MWALISTKPEYSTSESFPLLPHSPLDAYNKVNRVYLFALELVGGEYSNIGEKGKTQTHTYIRDCY